MYKRVIFDYDGTIVDSIELYKDAIVGIVNRYQLKNPEFLTSGEFRDYSIEEIYKRLGVSAFQLPQVIKSLMDEIKPIAQKAIPIDDMMKLIDLLKKTEIECFLISSNESDTVAKVLGGEVKKFTTIITLGQLEGKDRAISQLVRKMGGMLMDYVYIGDEIRDFEACKKARIDFIGVNWGINSKKALLRVGVNRVAESVADLENILLH